MLNHGGIPPAMIQRVTNASSFCALLDETSAVISSANFACVLEVALDRATSILFEGLEKNVFVSTEYEGSSGDVKLRLAGLLPGLARWCHLALSALPNELVDVSQCLCDYLALCVCV